MDGDLPVCNFKKCRKRLNSFAWITSCSHIFCDEDGSREFNGKLICPACDANLPGKHDILRISLNPSDEYKSMVISGQRPEVIMDICSRALSFWTYQCHQELSYQKFCCSKAQQQGQQVEKFYEQLLSKAQADLASIQGQIEALRKDLEDTKSKYREVSEKLREKSRQYQKLQMMYDGLRREKITFSYKERNTKDVAEASMQREFELPIGAISGTRKETHYHCSTSNLGTAHNIDPSLIALFNK
jgi:E3 ubiquitin-protein ligase CCNP1IP1